MAASVVGFVSALVLGWAGAASAALPDGRVYERVSPADRNAADVLVNPQRVRAGADGDAVQFSSLTAFGDVRGTGVSSDYLAVRDAVTGTWNVHGITPPQQPTSAVELSGLGLEPRYVGDFSHDLSNGVFMAKSPLSSAQNVAGVVNLYRRNDLRVAGAGTYQLLSDADTPQSGNAGIQPAMVGASADFGHVVFETTRNLTADAVGLDPSLPKLYEWANGVLLLAGQLPAGECGGAPSCPAAASQAGQGGLFHRYTTGVISRDGSRVVFTAPPFNASQTGGTLYLRDDAGTSSPLDDATVRVSASERSTPDPGGVKPATFWAASDDGAKIFFTTAEQLTDDDPNASVDLYRYDLDAPSGDRLTRISGDAEASDNVGGDVVNGHDVSGVLGASGDGGYVYFSVTQGQLVAGGPTGATGGPIGGQRIFVWHDGALREVGAVNASDELDRILGSPGGWGGQPKWSRVSPDGAHLAFVTQGTSELLQLYGHAGYDHGSSCPSLSTLECQEIYVYDAAAGDGAGELQCASCNPTGATATEDADFFNFSAVSASRDTSHLSHALSDDGRHVFFDTAEGLLPEDRNDVTDVYELDTVTRQVHLISGGRSGAGISVFMDASADGRDVFFTTRDRLVPGDVDQSTDLYDARVGGVAEVGVAPVPSCEDEGCRPPAASPPALAAPGSAGFAGPSDVLATAAPLPFFAVRPLTGGQRRHLIERGDGRVIVAASQGSMITLVARARVGRRVRTVASARARLDAAGEASLRLRLSVAARRRLRRSHRLHVTLVVRCSAVPRAQRLGLDLRSGRSGRGR